MPDYARVLDKDTGYKLTVLRSEVVLGNYKEVDEPTVDELGDPLPAEYPSTKSLSRNSNANDGQKATSDKETP